MASRSWGLYLVAVAAGIAPLWVGAHIPMVDLPQHLHLISVLHRLHDPTTIYPQLYAARTELFGPQTSYLGYYYAVDLLNWVVPEVLANRLFLTAYVAGMPLGLAFLLWSLKRPVWPSLLALPFAYGDSFAWGFINYCAAIPLAFVCMGCFVRAIQDAPRRRWWAGGLAASLVSVLVFHPQIFAFLAVALPLLLVTTSAPDDAAGRVKARMAALLGVVPGVALALAWVAVRLQSPTEIAPGQPWKAWGPTFSPQNLSFKSTETNWHDLLQTPANMLRDGSDRYALYVAVALAALAWLASLMASNREAHREGPIERWRLLALGAVALVLFFSLPFDIRGYVYSMNTRYVHLAGPLVLAAVPPLNAQFVRRLNGACVVPALLLAVFLGRGFAEFDEEAKPLDGLASSAGARPMVMGLIFATGSRVMNHPMFLHSAAVLARLNGGAPNFSFASTPHSPLKYRGEVPPTFPSEWHPEQFDYARMGSAYDDFLIRGLPPERILGPQLQSELTVAAQADGFSLVRRR